MLASKEKIQLKEVLQHVTTVVHVLALGLTVFIIYLCFLSDSFNSRSWHALLYTVGWFLLSLEGILYLSKDNIVSRYTLPRWRVHIHWIIITLGFVLTIAGFITIFINKTKHFSSVHGITGFISGILGCIACVSGIPTLFSTTLRKKIPPNWSKLFHAFVGSAAVVLGAVALITAFHKNWFISKTNNDVVTVCFIITVVITFWTLLRPVLNMFTRAKSVCS